MTTPSTAQYNAWGVVCAGLKAAKLVEPSGFDTQKTTRMTNSTGAYLDAIAASFSMTRAQIDAGIEASSGYTNTGGTGAICS